MRSVSDSSQPRKAIGEVISGSVFRITATTPRPTYSELRYT